MRLGEGEPLDPLHTVYTAVQHAASIFAERVSVLDEFEPYYDIVTKAEDEYMPSGPPMSPLTRSYFTTWAFFDLGFGPYKETMGKCLLDAGTVLGFDAKVMDAIKTCSESRMGIYEQVGLKGGRCLFERVDHGGAVGLPCADRLSRSRRGTLVRANPPADPSGEIPRVPDDTLRPLELRQGGLDRLPEEVASRFEAARGDASGFFLKHGKEPNHWNEFIFQAYHHHQFDAIFLAGLPDVPGSLPHGPKGSV